MDAIKFDAFQYYTYDEYKGWDGRWELINGIAYAMSPSPYPKHQQVVFRVAQELDSSLECSHKECEVYISPVDWKVNENTVVQPDVAIFCEKTQSQYFSKTPPLVVEVLSKATALKDVTTKFELYEKEGVVFYVILEPNSEVGDIFKLEDGEYTLIKKVTKTDKYEFIMDECKSVIDFEKVFK
jgi:Uma2 family endonuclease